MTLRYRLPLIAAIVAMAALLVIVQLAGNPSPSPRQSSAASAGQSDLAGQVSDAPPGPDTSPAPGGSSSPGGPAASATNGSGSGLAATPTHGSGGGPTATPTRGPGVGPTATPTRASGPPAPTPPPVAVARYVSPSGNDSASGGPGDPWLTLQKAANTAPSGATVYVRAGTYEPFELTRSGLTFSGYPGETAIVKGRSSVTDAIHIDGVSSATLTNLTVTGNLVQYGSGIAVDSSSGVTLSHLIVHDNTSFGIRTDNSSAVIDQSNVYENDSGIEIARSGTVKVLSNDIHNNDKMVDSGVGAQGVSFFYTTGSVVASNNRLWSNHTLPGDPLGPDGKAFEIYGASNVTMTANVMWDNLQVLETGTDGSRTPCSNLVYTRNLAYRSNSDQTMGLILRCADHSLVASNTFVALDKFAFDVSSNYESYGGSVEGLRILDNLVVNGRTYSIDDAIPSSVVMDYNLAYTTSAATTEYGTYDAWVAGHDQTTSLADFQSWTGQAGHDIWGSDPLLDSNYCPTAGSPAINSGTSVGLSYSGSAPDIGYCEVS
jgi:hypothetical protein